MKVDRPQFPVPVLCIDEFLPDEVAGEVLQECIDLHNHYTPASVFEGVESTRIDPSYRNNDVVYADALFHGRRSRSRTLTALQSRIRDEDCKALWHKGYTLFDTINYANWHGATISRYGDGAFYKRHRDTTKKHVARRLVTLVYYVNTEPAQFCGGALVLWSGKESLRLVPRHNRAVVFPSFAIHEVEKTQLAVDGWEHGRFSVNYWMGFS